MGVDASGCENGAQARVRVASRPIRTGPIGIATLLCLALASGCASKADAPKAPFNPPAEGWTLSFDGRPWEVASQTRAGKLVTEIFVLPGQTTEDWTERVVLTVLFGAQRTTKLDALLETTEKLLEADCRGFEFETIYVQPRDAMYTWRRPKCAEKKDRETDIVRVALGRAGLHTITYSAKTYSMRPGLKKRWTELVKEAQLGKRPEKVPSDLD